MQSRSVRAAVVLPGALVLLLFAALAGCGSGHAATAAAGSADSGAASPSAEEGDTVPAAAPATGAGSATMLANGTIVIRYPVQGPDGTIGYAEHVCPPMYPDYEEILEYVGGLAPGETKPLPPPREEITTTP